MRLITKSDTTVRYGAGREEGHTGDAFVEPTVEVNERSSGEADAPTSPADGIVLEPRVEFEERYLRNEPLGARADDDDDDLDLDDYDDEEDEDDEDDDYFPDDEEDEDLDEEDDEDV